MLEILVADPEPRINEVIRGILSSDNHRVRTAHTLADARAKWEEKPGDILIIDADFSSDLKALVGASPRSPMILVTGLLPTKPVVLQALRQGAFRFLTKPLSTKELKKALAEAEAELRQQKP